MSCNELHSCKQPIHFTKKLLFNPVIINVLHDFHVTLKLGENQTNNLIFLEIVTRQTKASIKLCQINNHVW